MSRGQIVFTVGSRHEFRRNKVEQCHRLGTLADSDGCSDVRKVRSGDTSTYQVPRTHANFKCTVHTAPIHTAFPDNIQRYFCNRHSKKVVAHPVAPPPPTNTCIHSFMPPCCLLVNWVFYASTLYIYIYLLLIKTEYNVPHLQYGKYKYRIYPPLYIPYIFKHPIYCTTPGIPRCIHSFEHSMASKEYFLKSKNQSFKESRRI